MELVNAGDQGSAAGTRATDKMLARLLVVNEVSAAALEHPSSGGVFCVVADATVRYITDVFELDEEAGEVVLRAQCPLRELGSGSPYRQSIAEGLVGVAVRERRSVLVNDVSGDPRYVPPPEGLPQPAAELCVPIFKSGRVAGVIDVESQKKDAFGDELAARLPCIDGSSDEAGHDRLFAFLGQVGSEVDGIA